MKTCKICNNSFEESNPRNAYCPVCKKKWKKPRDVYYHMKHQKEDPAYRAKALERSTQWQKENKEQFKINCLQRRKQLKLKVFSLYGVNNKPICCHCGYDDMNALCLDHVNNDGFKDEKFGESLYKYAIRHVSEKFQTLCYNCNWIKHLNNLKNSNPIFKTSRYRKKEICMLHYSPQGVCMHCGINDMRVLCLDHIHEDGNIQRKEIYGINKAGSSFYPWVIKNNFPEGLQVLCLNCNVKKNRLSLRQ